VCEGGGNCVCQGEKYIHGKRNLLKRPTYVLVRWSSLNVRERERESKRERERDTHRQRARERVKDRERKSESESERERAREIDRERERGRESSYTKRLIEETYLRTYVPVRWSCHKKTKEYEFIGTEKNRKR